MNQLYGVIEANRRRERFTFGSQPPSSSSFVDDRILLGAAEAYEGLRERDDDDRSRTVSMAEARAERSPFSLPDDHQAGPPGRLLMPGFTPPPDVRELMPPPPSAVPTPNTSYDTVPVASFAAPADTVPRGLLFQVCEHGSSVEPRASPWLRTSVSLAHVTTHDQELSVAGVLPREDADDGAGHPDAPAEHADEGVGEDPDASADVAETGEPEGDLPLEF